MGKEPDHAYSDEELLAGIINRDDDIFRFVADQAIPYLLKSMGKEGSRRLAEEIVHDASIVVYRQAMKNGLHLKCRFQTYFIAICKNIWNHNNRMKGKKSLNNREIMESIIPDEEEIGMLWMESREFRLYRRHFDSLKEKQRNILASALDGVPYRELFRRFGFKSEDAFKNEVFRIKRKLFQRIAEDPEFSFLKDRTYWSYDE